jgi:hypothetical protein
MDRSYLTHPGIVAAGWEGCLLYPVLWLHAEDGRLDESALAPAYLSVITRAPEGVCATGMKGLEDVGLIVVSHGVATIKACFSSRGGASRTRNAGTEKVEASLGASVRTPALAYEGLEEYLVAQWGELVSRGKPVSGWIAVQQDAHPGLDLLAESKKARAWELSQKKSKSAIRRFLASWFNRASGFKEETKIRAAGGADHWSGLDARDRDRALQEGRSEFSVLVGGASITRDLRDDMFVLSGQDLTSDKLPYRGLLSTIIRSQLNGNGDPYDPEPFRAALTKSEARAESNRALTWAVDQIVTDVRYELGLLPV